MAKVRQRAADITAIDANIQAMTANLAGSAEVHLHGPRTIEELQFSLPVQMALSALQKGNGYATHLDFVQGALLLDEESDVMRFARRIKLNPSPELDERYPRNFVAQVSIHYKDGTVEDLFVDHAKGMRSNPFTAEEHLSKLSELTYPVIGQEQADELFDVVDRLDPGLPVSELTALLALR